jgi:hypothetical protein
MKWLVIGPVFVPAVIGAEGAELAPRVAMSLFPPGSGFFERGFQDVFMATFVQTGTYG